ncbi:FecR family protein [Dinghuibacter silviterrae]|uniref:FecR family protein n=1 Tax=Dinghuibacter silviterrae TaxID=1539049 RepID=A0A4R8DEC6_9BACT|nr:FecR domain-containing protein [Dinghuibacter silviterrae]TDW95893.1 FecR family protein [Dinghuibacter silviterrae]
MEELAPLLEKYWAGTATQEEVGKLLALLTEREADIQAYLEKECTGDTDLSPMKDKAEGVLQKIHTQIDQRELSNVPAPKVIRPYFRAMAWVAAVAVGVILFVRLVMHEEQGTAPAPVSIVARNAEEGASSGLKQVANNTSLPRELRMEDGSQVILYPKSTVTYKQPFDRLERNINLQGKALFRVTGDIKRPFTVMAAGTATTALGTEFMVSDQPAGSMVSVRLIQGKVAIRVIGTSNEVTYLKPGEEFTLDHVLNKITLMIPGKKGSRNSRLEEVDKLSFSKEPLSNVFRTLEKFYHIKINCTAKVANGLFFTGEFYPSDSLDAVLAAICNTNDLTFEETPGGITITSHK